ncbi:glycoside hydrolase family 3 C-terminal domain-containing protein [Flavisolibacter ginsengisoli]|uniref:Beta-glucosidase n=1 Tax=Flavisolibacter ginsengisoli DSM 18119 TaxID=1121884 RepID=A0A1M5E6Y8_9BACT|nr:glycoside hydrolase family 3 N-terminal domain-containing protein [Flavisolibacter ginsengisoli]SHF74894.1 beta-glucosidase [Flavisolibacter ginsengisoli DSM 18119]
MKYVSLLATCLMIFSTAFSQSTKAKDLVKKMTQEEKVNLVVGMGMNIPGKMENGTAVGQISDKVAGAAGETFAIPRLGLPNTVVADGPAGLRIEPKRKNDPNTYYATAWPIASLLASTWDTELVQQVGEAMGNEVKEYGVDVLLGPGMNIHRNPLGGRNFEYYSEDPLVSGKMAVAMVNGIESNGVGTSIKHFAANNQETHRNSVNTIASERALREIYLRPFEIAVKEAQPWTVMSSYNLINGTFTSESRDLLTTILRKEWGFKGLVMTDWFGGKDAVAQLKAGNDLLMPGTPGQKKAITEALSNGSLDINTLNESAVRIVDYIINTQAFKKYAFSNKPDLKAHALLARQAAADGMVLLKNNSALPLHGSAGTIAAFGNTSYDFISGGTGSGDVNEAYTISLVDGLTNAGFIIDKELSSLYSTYVTAEKAKQPKKTFFEEFANPTPRIPELDIDHNLMERKANEASVALITIGRNAGEGSDRKVENDFNLKASEVALIDAVSKAFHAKGKKVIVIINSGGVIEVSSWQDKADALLLSWQPGLEAGNAVADVLSGKVNPSGRLATTFPVKYSDVASSKSFPGKEFPGKEETGMLGMKVMPAEVTYNEGIYVGYRYFNSFGVKPAYAFGYGLSYTRFNYSALKLSSSTFAGKLTASVIVTNSGSVAGKEVVQLYITASKGKLDKPSLELKAFTKTRVLQPGQSQTVSFTINGTDLASFDTGRSAWMADAGKYSVKIGASSEDIKLAADFGVAKEIVTQRVNKALLPQVSINEEKPLVY